MVRELELRNAELQRFASAISHDLKSPLLCIRGFLDLLETDFEAVTTGAALTTSLVFRVRRRRCSCSSGVCLITHAQDVRWPNIFIAPTLPIVNADRGQLVLVIQNLVDNTLKFCSDQRRPVVSIGVRKETDFPVYLVKDNGIGIESRFQERFFDLFERIDSEFEGSAVGACSRAPNHRGTWGKGMGGIRR